jgi:hypothetical protein
MWPHGLGWIGLNWVGLGWVGGGGGSLDWIRLAYEIKNLPFLTMPPKVRLDFYAESRRNVTACQGPREDLIPLYKWYNSKIDRTAEIERTCSTKALRKMINNVFLLFETPCSVS